MNEHDSERIAGMLTDEGMERALLPDDADLVVLNTCCIRENADNKLYGTLGHLKALKARRPELRIAVGGCLAQKDGEGVQRRAPHVDVVFGTHNLNALPRLLRRAAAGPVCEVVDKLEVLSSDLPVRRESHHSAWVTISVGCNNSCTFCIVPAVRGVEVSRRPSDIVTEIQQLAGDGVVEITLLGQNVNSYGRDLALDGRRPLFADLLRRVGEVQDIKRIRYTSPHPKDFKEDVALAMAEVSAVCPHLHLPVQSGSDRVLAAMHRGYTRERYLAKLALARSAVPDLAVTTDIIVGFPEETDGDFEATLDLVTEARFDGAFTFQYSPRPGTRAAEMPRVDPSVVGERYGRLTTLIEELALASHRARVGCVEEVLVEGPSKRDPGVLSGRTPHNRLVHFDGEGLAGELVSVAIRSASAHYLVGDRVA
jgi:tRNA-2-methylthio-N6-dimethylallyladenosine synthase